MHAAWGVNAVYPMWKDQVSRQPDSLKGETSHHLGHRYYAIDLVERRTVEQNIHILLLFIPPRTRQHVVGKGVYTQSEAALCMHGANSACAEIEGLRGAFGIVPTAYSSAKQSNNQGCSINCYLIG